jgi:uncharacterized protein YbbK (DUF523 family)
MIAVSACLLGYPCRYDEKRMIYPELTDLLKSVDLLPVCPEQLAGLPTPRKPAEILGGDGFDVLDNNASVYDLNGNNLTDDFIKGAETAVRQVLENDVTSVILKENSPSCGINWIHDGSFSGSLARGCGVATAMLRKHQIKVFGESETNLISEWLSNGETELW